MGEWTLLARCITSGGSTELDVDIYGSGATIDRVYTTFPDPVIPGSPTQIASALIPAIPRAFRPHAIA